MKNKNLEIIFLVSAGSVIYTAICSIIYDVSERNPEVQSSDQYSEDLRPQYHLTLPKGWIGDPNGLKYNDGEYHLFYQYNPFGNTWGHAISPDLIRWEQQEHKIWPDSLSTIFSGNAVVDHNNTTSFQTGDAKPSQPFTQGLAYSNDRDPKIIWHKPSEKWMMDLYPGRGHRFAIYTSPNLKEWTITQILEDVFYEIPDFFELPVDGDPNDTKWLFMDVSRDYLLGTFDGERFECVSGWHKTDYGNNLNATQTWDHVPDDRMIQIAWMRGGDFEGMPFNQQMSFPAELSVITTENGARMFRNPIQEIKNLYNNTHAVENITLTQGVNPLEGFEGDLFDMKMNIDSGDASVIGLGVGGDFPRYNSSVEYYTSDQTIRSLTYPPGMQNLTNSTAPLAPVDGIVELRILIDRTSIEIFGNDRQISITNHYDRTGDTRNIEQFLYAREGEATVQILEVHLLNSLGHTNENTVFKPLIHF